MRKVFIPLLFVAIFALAAPSLSALLRRDASPRLLAVSAKKKARPSARSARPSPKAKSSRRSSAKSAAKSSGKASAKSAAKKSARPCRRGRRCRAAERFTANSYAANQTYGDQFAGEDAVARQAAIDALGPLNGSIVAIDPSNGRILAMVNQRLALAGDGQPCSTIKLVAGLAALDAGLVTRDAPVKVGRRSSLEMTTALAHSNNPYFEALGRELGFARYSRFARQLGLGERAGLDIPGESSGLFPSAEIPARAGGVGKMCSFGEGIRMTPLQLGAIVMAMANGGDLYYLQHPDSPRQVVDFHPRLKRRVELAPLVGQMTEGLGAAVDYGTARHLRENFPLGPVFGKTGTCSRSGTRFGWFASYADLGAGRIVVVVYLEGGRPTFGPRAAEVAGVFLKNLADNHYASFGRNPVPGLRSGEASPLSAPASPAVVAAP